MVIHDMDVNWGGTSMTRETFIWVCLKILGGAVGVISEYQLYNPPKSPYIKLIGQYNIISKPDIDWSTIVDIILLVNINYIDQSTFGSLEMAQLSFKPETITW